MMDSVLPLSQVDASHRPEVGGKCFALAEMSRAGIPVPATVCVPTRVYQSYVSATGLRERIMLELNRKPFDGKLGPNMRWEELWDASLRIRNMFLRTPMPDELAEGLSRAIEARFADRAVAIRSSAPGEDSETVSFAGLHESFINVMGTDSILEHVRLVWASLWSDAALLYRRDLGLDVADSAMAVVVQELVPGDRSGVAFSRHPNDASQAVIESVYGLNQGLVDGTVEPDRWIIDRATGQVVSHDAAPRDERLSPGAEGVQLEPLPTALSRRPPLTSEEVKTVFDYVQRLEELFGAPQDVEWTWRGETLSTSSALGKTSEAGRSSGLVVLQSRPITTLGHEEADDGRRWYLSLRRSFENLQALRDKIEGQLIPGMIEEARALAEQPVDHLSDEDLAAEIDRRQALYDQWVDVYWDEFIPFAHGIRLFGQVYNDVLHPDDPYAFMDLLTDTEMASLARNRALEQMAATIRNNPRLAKGLREQLADGEDAEIDEAFLGRVDDFVNRFGDLSCAITEGPHCHVRPSQRVPDALIEILLQMSRHPPSHKDRFSNNDGGRSQVAMRDEYLRQFEGDERARAAELLDLARTSYQLRDDDNIHLGRIEAQVLVAVSEGRQRLESRGMERVEAFRNADVAEALRDLNFVPEAVPEEDETDGFVIRARQLVGQPAGPGVAHGPARVVVSQGDLLAFEHGEILVCDAVDPNMTFVVPLAAGVVERRGGMLIHGAIIAREYGLPCVTGVPDATSLIRTGDILTVDGHLGIVTLKKRGDAAAGASGLSSMD